MFQRTLIWSARIAILLLALGLFFSPLSSLWIEVRTNLYVHADKFGHFISMFVITWVGIFAFPEFRASRIMIAMLILSGFVELTQLTTSRSPDAIDFLTSCAGVGAVAAVYFLRDIRERLKPPI